MDDPSLSDTRPFMMDLWRKHRFRTDIVARRAEVSEGTVLALLRFQAVESGDAVKVLAALSSLYQQEYTLETVHVKLIRENV